MKRPRPQTEALAPRASAAGWMALAIAAVAGAITFAARSWAEARDMAQPAPPPASDAPGFVKTIDVSAFLRGNLHAHSTRSDGDSDPADVYAHYRDRGYAFAVLSDHNTRTDPRRYPGLRGRGFVMIPGEEITTTAAGKPVHVNAICTQRPIGGGAFATPGEALAWAVARVKAQGAIALVNHPNFGWALGSGDLPAAHGAELLEIWSGHPYVHTEGDELRPSHEALWTEMLDRGEPFAAAAVDDMHHLAKTAPEPAARSQRGWVEVFGARATEQAICDGLRRGRLYASTGPKLTRLRVGGGLFAITPRGAARIELLGEGGATLADVQAAAGKEVRYELRGGERYVRARITGPDGKRAWTQAYFTR